MSGHQLAERLKLEPLQRKLRAFTQAALRTSCCIVLDIREEVLEL
jgi:hypothetical protein